MSRKRRDRLTIMAQILNIAREQTLKSQIMYRANLSFAQLNEYMSFLVEIKLLKPQIDGSRVVYSTTKKGMKYLENFHGIRDLLVKTSEIERC